MRADVAGLTETGQGKARAGATLARAEIMQTEASPGAVRTKTFAGVGWSKGMSRPWLFVRQMGQLARHWRNAWGVEPRHCPTCGFRGYFHAYGLPPRYDAACARCGSLERHRLLALWLERNRDVWVGRRVLHFAPDTVLRKIIEPDAAAYIGADIVEVPGCRKLDIQQLDLEDASVDVIICSHVLEHVDDRKALSEMRRVVSAKGTVLIMTPVIDGWAHTYENPAVTSRRDRLLHFGQDDHVRYYGADVRDRIAAADFQVAEFVATEPDVLNHGLMRGDKVYIAQP